MRIEREISDLSAKADSPLRMLPLTGIRRIEELNDVIGLNLLMSYFFTRLAEMRSS